MTIKVKISNPLIDDLELTYLSQNISNTTSISVISSDFFVAPKGKIVSNIPNIDIAQEDINIKVIYDRANMKIQKK